MPDMSIGKVSQKLSAKVPDSVLLGIDRLGMGTHRNRNQPTRGCARVQAGQPARL